MERGSPREPESIGGYSVERTKKVSSGVLKILAPGPGFKAPVPVGSVAAAEITDKINRELKENKGRMRESISSYSAYFQGNINT